MIQNHNVCILYSYTYIIYMYLSNVSAILIFRYFKYLHFLCICKYFEVLLVAQYSTRVKLPHSQHCQVFYWRVNRGLYRTWYDIGNFPLTCQVLVYDPVQSLLFPEEKHKGSLSWIQNLETGFVSIEMARRFLISIIK